MAHIPYGYRIERGRASPEPGQAEKLNAFIGAYLKDPGFAILPDDITVQNMFQTEEPEGQCSGSAAEVAGAVYNLIVPAKNGRTFMNSKEKAMVNAWAGKMEERVWQ